MKFFISAQITLPKSGISIRNILKHEVHSVLPKMVDTSTLKYKNRKHVYSEHLSRDVANIINGLKLRTPLMSHQRNALEWMISRENDEPCGGLLADDMGLGKTFTFLSLILAQRAIQNSREVLGRKLKGKGLYICFTVSKPILGFALISVYMGGTLVVCPASLVGQWQLEVKERIRSDQMKTCVYHGSKRLKDACDISTYDLVITTYAMVLSEHKNRGPLFNIEWHRVAIEEAHQIRNPNTACAVACFNLKGKRRWLISGTPVQNYSLDIYPLLKFLHHSTYSDLSNFKEDFLTSGQEGLNLLSQVLGEIMLRRTKCELINERKLKIPNKFIKDVNLECTADEMSVYAEVAALSKKMYAKYMAQKCIKKHIGSKTSSSKIQLTNLFVMIIRLRQICNHPGLIDAVCITYIQYIY